MKQKIFTLALPSTPLVPNADYPARNQQQLGGYTASQRLPESLRGLPQQPALYRLFIYENGELKYAYVGETVNLARRMGEYSGVVRRLLLLHCGAPHVYMEKHPVRYIQYRIADALLNSGYEVKLYWTDLEPGLSKRERVAAERTEVEHLRSKGVGVLTGLGNFHSQPHEQLSAEWQKVQTRLAQRAYPARRGQFL